jgi:hypothetical protein
LFLVNQSLWFPSERVKEYITKQRFQTNHFRDESERKESNTTIGYAMILSEAHSVFTVIPSVDCPGRDLGISCPTSGGFRFRKRIRPRRQL